MYADATPTTERHEPADQEQVKTARARKRVQLDYEVEAFNELEALRKLGRHRNLASLFRDAIRVYRWLLTRSKEGYQIQIIKGDEKMTLDTLLNF